MKLQVDLNSQKGWDDSTLTKEELKALLLTKREAFIKRERAREYYLSHRVSFSEFKIFDYHCSKSINFLNYHHMDIYIARDQQKQNVTRCMGGEDIGWNNG